MENVSRLKTSAFLWIEVDLFVQGVEIHEIVCNKSVAEIVSFYCQVCCCVRQQYRNEVRCRK